VSSFRKGGAEVGNGCSKIEKPTSAHPSITSVTFVDAGKSCGGRGGDEAHVPTVIAGTSFNFASKAEAGELSADAHASKLSIVIGDDFGLNAVRVDITIGVTVVVSVVVTVGVPPQTSKLSVIANCISIDGVV